MASTCSTDSRYGSRVTAMCRPPAVWRHEKGGSVSACNSSRTAATMRAAKPLSTRPIALNMYRPGNWCTDSNNSMAGRSFARLSKSEPRSCDNTVYHSGVGPPKTQLAGYRDEQDTKEYEHR